MSLLDSFLKHKGWIRGSEKAHIAPLLPYFIADCIYLTYDEYLSGRLKQKEKYHGNLLMRAYHHFIHDFFNAFDERERDEVIEMMDCFNEYIHNDLEMLRLQVQKPFMEVNADLRALFSASAVCRVLSAHAEYAWQNMYRRDAARPIPNTYLAAMSNHARELFRECSRYTPRYTEHSDLAEYDGIKLCVKNVVNRIVDFVGVLQNDGKTTLF